MSLKNVEMNQWNTKESCGTRLVSYFRKNKRWTMGSEILLYMNMFSDFLKYWNFVVIVFENTGIMTRFLCMKRFELWTTPNKCGVSLDFVFFFRNRLENEVQHSSILNYYLQKTLVFIQLFKRLPVQAFSTHAVASLLLLIPLPFNKSVAIKWKSYLCHEWMPQRGRW